MTVLLVLATFAIFLTIDHFYAKAKHPALRVAPAMTKQAATAPALKPSLVGGFEVPDNRRYHPGHTWALGESPNLVRIGIDDLAAKIDEPATGMGVPFCPLRSILPPAISVLISAPVSVSSSSSACAMR